MDPRLNDDEKALRRRAREAAGPLVAAAAAIDAGEADPRDLLAGLAEAGVLGAGLEPPHGDGAGLLGVVLACEELGAASAAIGVIVAGHLAATSLLAAGAQDDADDELLAGLAAGARLAALVLNGAVTLLEEPAVSVRAVVGGDGVRLDGEAGAVAGAAAADLLVIPAHASENATTIVAHIDAGADGVTRAPGGRTLGLNGAAVAGVIFEAVSARRCTHGDVDAALAAARDRARVAHAAVCVGIGRAALDAAIAFVEAGDATLGGSQSVQWMLADAATETEAARLLTWYAASRRDAGELREAAAMARLVAAEAAVAASRRAVQVMGPAGNSTAAGVERLYRDAKAMEVHHGAVEAQRAAVARQLLPDLLEDAADGSR